MASQLFSRAENGAEDEEQLLKLFWNRAELKKELDKLRNETYSLTDQLKQEQAVKLRVQQRLQQLEAILANPATASSAIAYYQLKRVWALCHDRLASVAAELLKSHHDKEYRQHVAAFRRKLYQSLMSVQRELNEVNQKGELLNAEILKLREQRSKYGGIWHFVSRRRLTAEISLKRSERRSVTMRLGELTEEIQARSSAEPPQFGGLDVETRRIINLSVIAYAQEFYLHFADHEIAAKAHEASVRQVGDIRYGDTRDCRSLCHHADESIKILEADTGLHERVQGRMQHLQTVVQYRKETDTIPAVESLNELYLLRNDGSVRSTQGVNVLLDEYWDLFDVLQT
jgi:hypothetical protein